MTSDDPAPAPTPEPAARADRPGRRLPTSHDVALEAGVSQPTVSRALRGDPRVTEATRRRVLAAAERLGYVTSDRGRSLATRRTSRIGVVVEDLDNPFYLELLDVLHERLERADVRMIVLTPQRNDPERVERLVDGSIDGAILTTTHLDSPLPAQLRARRFPFVLLNRTVDDPAVTSCSVDNRRGAIALAEETLRAGHRDVAAIFGPETTSTGRDREDGIRRVLADAGVPLPEARVRRGRFTFRSGHEGCAALLGAGDRPTVVLCANDVVAFGAINAARGLGLSVPGDVSITGFDDIAMASWEVFRLTTVSQDLRRMAETAVDLVLALVDAPHGAAERIVLPAEIVHRDTLAPPGR
jgi:LacI family transcriptional regulator, galactose operon repressor